MSNVQAAIKRSVVVLLLILFALSVFQMTMNAWSITASVLGSYRCVRGLERSSGSLPVLQAGARLTPLSHEFLVQLLMVR